MAEQNTKTNNTNQTNNTGNIDDFIISQEYCCSVSPPGADGKCLHIARFYKKCPGPSTHATTNGSPVYIGTMEMPPYEDDQVRIEHTIGRYNLGAQVRRRSYPVYQLAYLGHKMLHHKLFIQTGLQDDVCGLYIHVTGSDEQDMKFSSFPGVAPEATPGFCEKTLVGSVANDDFDDFVGLCFNHPPPLKQYHGAHRLDPSGPARGSREWTEEILQLAVVSDILEAWEPSEE